VQIGSETSFVLTQDKFDELKMKNSYKGTFTSDAQRNAFLNIVDNVAGEQFKDESGLTMISLPRLITMRWAAFKSAGSLLFVDLPKVTRIEAQAFRESGVTRVHAPLVTFIGWGTFGDKGADRVIEAYFPKLETPELNSAGDLCILNGAVNAATTHITLPSKFNTDEWKDKIFGPGNW